MGGVFVFKDASKRVTFSSVRSRRDVRDARARGACVYNTNGEAMLEDADALPALAELTRDEIGVNIPTPRFFAPDDDVDAGIE